MIRTFTSAQWNVHGYPKEVNVFGGLGGKRWWLGLVAFVILVSFAGFLIALIGLAIMGLVVFLVRTTRRTPLQEFPNALLADVNDCIVELTGNRDARLTVKDLVALRESGKDIPLPVMGISGLSLRVQSDEPRQERIAAISRVADGVWTTRVIVSATPPDYGTASFDRLLAANLDTDC